MQDQILVTGATGFVGSNVVRRVLDRGYKVRALVRNPQFITNLENLNVETVKGDLLDKESLKRSMRGCRFVFHVAAMFVLWHRDPDVIYKVNVEGTRNVLESAYEQGIERVVYTSTVATCGVVEDERDAVDETHSFNLQYTEDHYTISKYKAERVVMEFVEKGLDVVIVNPTVPVGAGDIRPTPTGMLILKFLNGEIPCYIDSGANFVNVKDVAEGHVLALLRGKRGERYIIGNENLKIKEFFEKLAQISGFSAPHIKLPVSILKVYAFFLESIAKMRPSFTPFITRAVLRASKFYLFANSEKAKGELGYTPSSVEEGIREAILWFLKVGYIKKRTAVKLKEKGFL